jgi:[ribosomal protein S18]-alanine N-acetyltransferase
MRRAQDVLIRPAREGDIDALLAIENAVFPTDRLDRRSFRHAVRSPTIDLIAAVRDGAVLGYAAVHRRRGSTAGHLASIAVSAKVLGQGLGRRLLAAAEAQARKQGCTRLRLEVRADNVAAQCLYDSAAYRRLDTIEAYYEDGEAASRYEKNLAHQTSSENRSTSRNSSTKRRAP